MMYNEFIERVGNFNSIKVRLELRSLDVYAKIEENFNSIKVRLELTASSNFSMVSSISIP